MAALRTVACTAEQSVLLHKLRVFALAFERLLFFDSDVYFMSDPGASYFAKYGAARVLAAAHFPIESCERYFNSGIMLLRPSAESHAALMRRWASGDFEALFGFAGKSGLTEQDLLIATFGDAYTRMDVCDNFRGAHRPYHRNCTRPPTIHADPVYMERARKRLAAAPAASRCVGALGAAVQQARTELSIRGRRGAAAAGAVRLDPGDGGRSAPHK